MVYPTEPPLGPPPPVVPPPWGGPPLPPPQPPEPSGPTRGRVALIVALVVLIALVATALVVAVVRRDDDDPESSTGSTPTTAGATTTTPPTTGPTPTTAPPADLDAVIDEVIAFVEQERGLEFQERPVVELLGEGAFQDRLLADFDEDRGEIEDMDGLLTALGAIDSDVELVEAMRELLAGAVVGFYDPETNELVVRGSDPTPYVRKVMAHELVHALDDQWFELNRPDVEETDDERDFGFTALVEGSARLVEDAYFESMGVDEQAEAQAEELMLALSIDIFAIPEILIPLINAPYEYGPVLVGALLDEGGQERFDAAFDDPPTTSEQVLEPEAYLDGEGAVAVGQPAAEGEAFDQGVLGQLMLIEILDLAIDRADAEDAAEGWGGDAYVAWQDGGDSCVRATVVGDTDDDTAALSDAIQAWADETGADVETGAGGVTFTRCA